MKRCGATCSARDFYWAVNQAYHTVEAEHYDELHETMFLGLEPVWHLLLDRAAAHPAPKLRVLDVGAGTGLVSGFVEMHLAERVASMTMLDPCMAMLDQCRRRAGLFSFPCEFRHGDIHALAEGERYDVITVNSVLHHIVELPAFFERVRRLLAPQGWLLTAQDPRAEALTDPLFHTRRAKWRRAQRRFSRAVWSRCRRLLQHALGRSPVSPLATQTSDRLLEQHLIRQPMPMTSIYAVTDFHVPGRPEAIGRGIALAAVGEWLKGLTLVEDRTYQFHGVPWTGLTVEAQELERAWWAARDSHGELMATAWRLDLQP